MSFLKLSNETDVSNEADVNESDLLLLCDEYGRYT